MIAPDRGQHVAALAAQRPVLGQVVQLDHAVLVGPLRLLGGAEHVRPRALGRRVELLGQLGGIRTVGEVVGAQHHVLRRRRQRRAVRGGQDVVGRQHQDPGLGLSLRRQRQVDRHLVAVEVGVEGVAHQRVDLDGLALHQHRLERLDTQAVQRRRAVQQHRVLVDDLLEHVPHLGDHRVDHLLGRLDVLRGLALHEAGHDERLEQLQGHQLGQAALVQAQRRARHDHRPAGVVHALAQQVLAEAALLALQHVRERLQRPVARAGDGAPAPAVVEQRVDGLLQHALLVVDDDLRRAQVQQPLEAVVAVDDAAVEVVEVRRGEAPTVQLHHGTQLRRDDRHGLEHHHLGLVARRQERGDDLQALDGTGLLLALGRLDLLLQVGGLGVEIHLLQQVADRLGAHAAAEVLAEAVGGAEPVAQLAERRLVVDDVLGLHRLEQVPHLAHPLGGVLDVGLGVVDVGLEALAQVLEHLLALVVGQLGDVDIQGLGPQVVVVREVTAGLGRGEVLLAAGQGLLELEHALFLLGGVGVEDLVDLALKRLRVLGAGLLVDPGHHRSGEVQDLLQLLGRHVEQVADAAGHALEEPDVRDRGGQVDVAHALAAHLGAGHLDAAALADDALVADALVLAAVALPVLGGTEDALAEEPVLLWLQRPVVDGLRLGDLARAPRANLLGGGEADLDCVEVIDVDQSDSLSE